MVTDFSLYLTLYLTLTQRQTCIQAEIEREVWGITKEKGDIQMDRRIENT